MGKAPLVFWGLEAGTLLDTMPGVTPNKDSSLLDVSDAEGGNVPEVVGPVTGH